MLLSDMKYCALTISILWIHDPEAAGHTDPRTILRGLIQSFQQLNMSEMHQYIDSFTFSLGVTLYVRLPGLDCSHLSWWLNSSKHLAPTYPLKTVGKMSLLKIQVISFEKHMQYSYWYLTFLPVGVASTEKAYNLEGFCFVSLSECFHSIQDHTTL